MRVVDVVARAVGEHGVDEVGLDLRRHRSLAGEPAGVAPGRLVLEVPADLVVLDVAVDEHRRGQHRVGVGRAAQHDAVLGLDPAHLGDGHARAYWAVPGGSSRFRVRSPRGGAGAVHAYGYHVFASSGDRDHALTGHHVDAFTPGPRTRGSRSLDGIGVSSSGADGQWCEHRDAHDLHLGVDSTCAATPCSPALPTQRVLRCRAATAQSPLHDPFERDRRARRPGTRSARRSIVQPRESRRRAASAKYVVSSSERARRRHPALRRRRCIAATARCPVVQRAVHEARASTDDSRPRRDRPAPQPRRGRHLDVETTGLLRPTPAHRRPRRRRSTSPTPRPLRHRVPPLPARSPGRASLPSQCGLHYDPGMIDTRMLAARNGTLALGSRAGRVWSTPPRQRHLDQQLDRQPRAWIYLHRRDLRIPRGVSPAESRTYRYCPVVHALDLTTAVRLVALGHERADEDDALALLARRSSPSRRGSWCSAGLRARGTPGGSSRAGPGWRCPSRRLRSAA